MTFNFNPKSFRFILFFCLNLLGLILPLNQTDAQEHSRIIFLGDSITAGYGLLASEAYPALLAKEFPDYQFINAGISGDTTAGGLVRLASLLKYEANIENSDNSNHSSSLNKILIIALGANDGLRGIAPEVTKDNLRKMVKLARDYNPQIKIILAGMQMPILHGEPYRSEFAKVFPELAKEENLALIPFLLEDVAGIEKLNQYDALHPNAEGQKIIANNVKKILTQVLKSEEELNRSSAKLEIQ